MPLHWMLPVIALDDAAQAVPLARSLAAGGIPVAEVTFRTAAGEEAIRRIAQEVPYSEQMFRVSIFSPPLAAA